MAMSYNANSSFCSMEAEEKVWNYTIFFRSHCGNDGVDPYALSTLFIQAKKHQYGYFLFYGEQRHKWFTYD